VAAIDRVTIDYEGVGEVLHSSEFHDAAQQVAEQVAAHARARGLRLRNHEPVPIEVFDDPSPTRVGVTVAVRHPAGPAWKPATACCPERRTRSALR